MAAGSSVTWTHCSVRYKVILRVNRLVRADALKRQPTQPVRANAACSSFPPSPPSRPSRSLTRSLMSALRLQGPSTSAQTHPSVHAADAVYYPYACSKKKKKQKKNFFFSSSCCPLEKRKKKFGFQSPRSPSSTGFASEAMRRRKFFGLVPLLTHPSSIPVLSGLTPKFLSLSLHSF
jgi:hypothetical protein